MKKRTIKNGPTVTVINNSNGKTFTANKAELQKAIKKWEAKVVAISLAAGLGIGSIATPLITELANSANQSKNTKEAVTMAASTDRYLKSLKENQILQAVISQEETLALEELSSAISTYKKLESKKDKTFGEERRYMEACKKICESKNLIVDTYTDTIKGKVAEAYRITDPEEIEKIEITDLVHGTSTSVSDHNPKIVMPDGTIIEKNSLLNKNQSMNSILAENIVKARSLQDAPAFSENVRVEDLPIDAIIETFEKAKDFEEKYTISCKDNGDLKAVESENVVETEIDEEER